MTSTPSAVAVDAPPHGPSPAQRAVIWGAVVVGVVLRWWALWSAPPTFDETWEGAFSHLPFGTIPTALRHGDPHPPLDYLIRHWFGGLGDTFALRVPSAVFACLTLALVVWWMWDRGWFGVLVIGFTSLSSFELLYSHIARMYSLAALIGTLVAVVTERWLRDGSPRWRWCMGAALVVGLFTHASFLLLAGGIGLVPWLRRDAEAWRWRATVVGALGIWAAVWGGAFVGQLHKGFDPIPLTTVSSIGDTLNGLVTRYAAFTVPVVVALALGAWALWHLDRRLGLTALFLFGAPLVVACVGGRFEHILFSRLLAPSVWAVPVVLAALVEGARLRSHRLGLVAGALVGIMVLSSIGPSVVVEDGTAPALRTLAAAARPGDAVAVYPTYLWTLTRWTLGSPVRPAVPAQLGGLNAYVYKVGSAPFSGRVWVLEPTIYAAPLPGWDRCPAPVPKGGVYTLQCFTVPADAPDHPVANPNGSGSRTTPSG
jgi:hypothetical protein